MASRAAKRPPAETTCIAHRMPKPDVRAMTDEPSPPARSDPHSTTAAHKIDQYPACCRLGDPELNLNLRSGLNAIGNHANRCLLQ